MRKTAAKFGDCEEGQAVGTEKEEKKQSKSVLHTIDLAFVNINIEQCVTNPVLESIKRAHYIALVMLLLVLARILDAELGTRYRGTGISIYITPPKWLSLFITPILICRNWKLIKAALELLLKNYKYLVVTCLLFVPVNMVDMVSIETGARRVPFGLSFYFAPLPSDFLFPKPLPAQTACMRPSERTVCTKTQRSSATLCSSSRPTTDTKRCSRISCVIWT